MKPQKIWLAVERAYCHIDRSDVKWHGWLFDDEGTPLRKATEAQYRRALKLAAPKSGPRP